MAMQTEPYQYRVLEGSDPIRLIELQPSQSITSSIQCRLIHISLTRVRDDIASSYTALSYVWGSLNETTHITVDNANLQITSSLDCALRHIRDKGRQMYVWADGICINQQDNVEKAQQVNLMGRIYSIAHHTVIYLGPGSSNSEYVLRKISECYDDGTYSNVDTDPVLDSGLRKILNTPWFTRVWVLQEVVLSRDPRVQWGSSRCSWKALSQMAHFLYSRRRAREMNYSTGEHNKGVFSRGVSISVPRTEGATIPSPTKLKPPPNQAVPSSNSKSLRPTQTQSSSLSKNLVSKLQKFEVLEQMQSIKDAHDRVELEDERSLRTWIQASTRESPDGRWIRDLRTLLEVMISRAGLGVSDHRDMVYAHLGLTRYADIKVDYAKTTAEVYQDIAWQMLKTFGLRVLDLAFKHDLDKRGSITSNNGGVTTSCWEKLPSWVPNWTLSHKESLYGMMEHVGYGFDPSDAFTSAPYHRFTSQPAILCTEGQVIGTLIDIGPLLNSVERPQDVTGVDGVPHNLPWGTILPGRPPMHVEGMWQKYILHQYQLGLPDAETLSRRLLSTLIAKNRIHLRQHLAINSGMPKFHPGIFNERKLAILVTQFWRGLVLVPSSSKNGDRVCCLEGSLVPFVVRDIAKPRKSVTYDIIENMKLLPGFTVARDVKHVQLVGGCFVDQDVCNKGINSAFPKVWVAIH